MFSWSSSRLINNYVKKSKYNNINHIYSLTPIYWSLSNVNMLLLDIVLEYEDGIGSLKDIGGSYKAS